MKQALLALGLALALPAAAQHSDHKFNYTVFETYRELGYANSKKKAVTEEQVRNNFPGWNVSTDKLSAAFRNLYGDAISVPGATLNDKVSYCMDNKLSQLDVAKAEWKQTRLDMARHASFVDFERYVDGHKVIFSNLSFRFTKDNRLVRIKMSHYGNAFNKSGNVGTAQDMLRVAAINDDLANDGIIAQTKEVKPEWVWFPVPTAKGYDLLPAYEFYITGKAADGFPVELRGYVAAADGKLLYRTNEVSESFEVKVAYDTIYKQNRVDPPVEDGLPDIMVTIDGVNYYANDTGLLAIADTVAPIEATFPLRGRWSRVRVGGGNTPQFNATIQNNGSTFIYPDTAGSAKRYINAYYHTTRSHDFMKKYLPDLTRLDVDLATNVDMTGTCNAYYSGGGSNNMSINFFPEGGGCMSFAEIGDIVYHEYGHGISYQFYTQKGAQFSNGSMGEGYSDVWGMAITGDSILGRFRTVGQPSSYIRRYDGAPMVYPINVNGEVHNDGEIIAGAWWDVAKNTGSLATMTDLFAKSYYDLPNAPNGNEGELYYDILIATILNDDNDGALSNGTPHLREIVSAFARHGIFLMTGAEFTHTEVDHQPAGTPVTVNATLGVSDASFFGSMQLFYRVRGGQWDSTAMTSTGGMSFTGQLPGFQSYSVVDYYFKVYDALNNSTYGFPNGYNTVLASNQVTIPYQFAVGVRQSFKNDFESDITGWTLGDAGDKATQGKWVHAQPVGTFYQGLVAQPGNDHTTGGGKCLVTGNGNNNYNSADVDMGNTTATSPVFDMNNFSFPVIEYYRWFSNDRGSNARSDAWVVQIRDSTSPFWIPVEQTYQSDYNWRRRVFHVREYLSTARWVQIRFVANDAVIQTLSDQGQNCIEAAVDDFAMYDLASLSVDATVAENRISVYPNPANEQITVAIPAGLTGVISLYDLTGRVLASEPVTSGMTQFRFNTSGFATGQYLLNVQTDKLTEVKKVVISH